MVPKESLLLKRCTVNSLRTRLAYRHTVATRLLGEGASFQTIADILGNTAEVVRKHYGKWSKGRQGYIDRVVMDHFQRGAITAPVTRNFWVGKLMKIKLLCVVRRGGLEPPRDCSR